MTTDPSRDRRRNRMLNLSLFACFISGLGCGTMYLYSAYSPQLASQLSLTATSTSFIGMVGNLGMGLSGPVAGRVVDKYGSTMPIIIGAISTFSGFTLVRTCYAREVANVGLLAAALAMVGVGSTFAFSATMKTAALNFPKSRGFATSVPMAAFGLSAFFISTTAAIAVPGDTLGFLTILSYLPPGLFLGSMYFVRHIPASFDSRYERIRMTDKEDAPKEEAEEDHHDIASKQPQVDITGMRLLSNRTFWAHFLVMGIIAGVGQMYIYSCGYCVKALVGGEQSGIDESVVQQIQQLQVGIISLSSFAGRIISGSLSDFIHNKHHYQRTWLLVGAGCISLVAQFTGLTVKDPGHLWMISAATGLAYGLCYGSYPTIVGDFFGMKHFSQNWGLLALSPLVASNLFNMLFGYYYDTNSVPDGMGHQTCLLGRACYSSAFKVTVLAAIFVIFLALEIILAHKRR